MSDDGVEENRRETDAAECVSALRYDLRYDSRAALSNSAEKDTMNLRSWVTSLTNRIPCLSATLHASVYPLESALLSAVCSRLAPAAKEILTAQLSAVNRIDRRFGETLLYQKSRGKPSRENAIPFPARHLESKLATVIFECPCEHGRRLRADLWLVQGYLFEIKFDVVPSRRALRTRFVSIWEVTIHVDPMRCISELPRLPDRPSPVAYTTLHGWLATWSTQFSVTGFWAPLQRSDRNALLATHNTAFPAEYLELIDQTNGLLIENVLVRGAEDVTSTNVAGEEYVLLADIQDRKTGYALLAVKSGCTIPEIFRLQHDSDAPECLGASFKSAIERVIEDNKTGK